MLKKGATRPSKLKKKTQKHTRSYRVLAQKKFEFLNLFMYLTLIILILVL